jgi:signal transduction histidine kinase/ligand-binding sensor domain-containing protein/DNA-binding response OmpR family regulator
VKRLFLILSIVASFSFPADGRPYYFRHYTNDNGLSNNTVMAGLQDRRGFMWFATKEGLNRFDGSRFRIFSHNHTAPNSLPNNYIMALCEDNQGWIWVGTARGVCYYMPDNDYFGTIEDANYPIDRAVVDIVADNDNNIWLATFTGTYKYSKQTGKFTHYPGSEYFLPINFTLTNAGDVWISAADGSIYKYNARTDDFSKFKILSDKEIAASVSLGKIVDAGNYGFVISTKTAGLRLFEPNSGEVTGLFTDDIQMRSRIVINAIQLFENNNIWIGSESGIHIYNLETGFVKSLQMVPTDPFSLSNNAVRFLYRDREGGTWAGTFYGGVNYLPQENKPFEKFYPTGLPGSLSGNVVREIRADSYGKIWIGTEDAGLIKMDPLTGIFSSYYGNNPSRINSRNTQGVLVDNDELWVGTYDNGIYILNPKTGNIKYHFTAKDPGKGLRTNSFITFLKTSGGTVYAGSYSGMYRFNRETSSFSHLENVAPDAFIHALYEDSRGIVWIGTYGRGLYRYDPSSEICEQVISDKGDYGNLDNEFITSIYEDRDHNIWFTTEGNGFSYISAATGGITRFIPGREVEFAIYCAILQDSHGQIWITSTRGLLRYDPATGHFTVYTRNDGLLGNAFSYNSAWQDKNGRIYFGMVNGLLAFNPAEIKENTYNPPVYFTDFHVNAKAYPGNAAGSPDSKSILVTDRISLKHNQSSLSIDFVSPSFTSPNLTRYRYMMEGADPDWVEISGSQKVTYANLSPGDYIFRVISSTNGNIWSQEEARLRIRIFPPVWLSVPAYILYLITAGLILYFLIFTYLKRKAIENQRQIEAIEAGKEREILNAKINFFTSITHEVRTPLTLIKGPLDRILNADSTNPDGHAENLLIMKKNTDRLLSLTNQLLDFRKTEKEMLRLNYIRTDLYELIESTYNLFLPYSEEKHISVRLHSPVNHYELALDREAIIKILSNLFSNAIKFAESSVEISLELGSDQDAALRIRVNNDGRLIPKESAEKIFEPFYQLDSNKPGAKGTGLGLSLARSIAELHQGRLFLDNSVSNCNSFVLELPKFHEETFSITENAEGDSNPNENEEFEVFSSPLENSPDLLLVEDEVEMGRFIAKEISGEYNVILTHNGEEALKALKKFNIILVVSDVIMPVMNGYELCRQIKSTMEFSHIPVILLTASVHVNAKIEGLDSGADAYLEKPFATEHLMAQILNLIRNRRREQQNFINSPLAHFRSVALNKTDEDFLKKLNSTLIDNISETDLSVEKISEIMGISVSTLYRKVKALTDLNSVEYIRLTRLKKAAELLAEGNFRINEISYLVGFSSPSYFATSFQKQFGISPSQFVRKIK